MPSPADSTDESGVPPAWWRCRALADDGSLRWFAMVRSHRYADGETVELPDAAARRAVGQDADVTAHLEGTGRVVRIDLTPRAGWTVPQLWFAELAEPRATPPAVTVVAFSGHDVAPASVLRNEHLRELGVTSADQVGAIRWYPVTGEVDQVYVAPDWRRRRVASTLAAVAGILNEVGGLPRLWGDGQRTELGEQWRRTATWADRGAPLTHVAPPMTPDDQG